MYLNAHISVSINGIQVPYICSIDIKDDSQHIGASCDIVLPASARIKYKNGNGDFLTSTPAALFNTGDTIMVKAQYDGYDWLTEFEGYLYDFYNGTPMKIVCQDSVYLLNQAPISKHWKSVSLKNLIEYVLQGTGVTMLPIGQKYTSANGTTVTNPVFDLQLENITFRLQTPAAILDSLKKEFGINISLVGKNLYVNIASNTTSTAKYDTTINVISSDLQTNRLTKGKALKSVYLKLKVKAWFIRENGTKDSFEVGDEGGQQREVFFYKIPKTNLITIKTADGLRTIPKAYYDLANEALEKFKQRRFQGGIETYLYPQIGLFWRAEYKDFRYPERNGIYTVHEINTTLDSAGFRRKIKLAYLGDL